MRGAYTAPPPAGVPAVLGRDRLVREYAGLLSSGGWRVDGDEDDDDNEDAADRRLLSVFWVTLRVLFMDGSLFLLVAIKLI